MKAYATDRYLYTDSPHIRQAVAESTWSAPGIVHPAVYLANSPYTVNIHDSDIV